MTGYKQFQHVNSCKGTLSVIVGKYYLTEDILVYASLYFTDLGFTNNSFWNVFYYFLKLLLYCRTFFLSKDSFAFKH